MTHLSYPRWPDLCQYADSDQIQSHWPQTLGNQYCIPPAINILYWRYQGSHTPSQDWKMGQRLQNNIGWKWQYHPTRWIADGKDNELQISFYSLKRDPYWEFSMEAFLWSPKRQPIGAGEVLKPYATQGYPQNAYWAGTNSLTIAAWSFPYWTGGVRVIAASLHNMWDEVPQDLRY